MIKICHYCGKRYVSDDLDEILCPRCRDALMDLVETHGNAVEEGSLFD